MLEVILSGIIQGILEWVPVSSQGIITLILMLTGYSLQQATDVAFFLHSGTLLATISYFWTDIKKILHPETSVNVHTLLFLVWSTLSSLIMGVPFYLLISQFDFLSNTGSKIIGVLLIIMGLMHGVRKELASRGENSIGKMDGLLTGFFQGFSALPGISRSGVTTLALLIRGFDVETALKYSFIAGLPVIAGLQIIEFAKGMYFDPVYLAAGAAAFLVGRVSIGYMLKLAKTINFATFCIVIGLISIFL